jgi:exosortase
MTSASTLREGRARQVPRWPLSPLLLIGLFALVGPVMVNVAGESWGTEQGAHGPLVLAIGLWLLGREWPVARHLARPGSAVLATVLFAVLLPLYVFARVTSTVEIEGASMCALLLTAGYALWGGAALARVWFPLFFLLFAFPPPDTLFAMLTQPLKIAVSQWAVSLLHLLGYPIAGSGVSIQIGQYEMLVAAACAGMNSLISLTALGLFYVYIRHGANLRYMLLLAVFILPVAVVANLVRVLLLLLITYHFGEAAGQGFFHEAAGLTMFLTALLGIFLVDRLATPLRGRLTGSGKAAA